jgi:flagellar basal body-associated protein FliL
MSWLSRNHEEAEAPIYVEAGEHRGGLVWIVLGVLAGLAAGAAVIWIIFRPKGEPVTETEAEEAPDESY